MRQSVGGKCAFFELFGQLRAPLFRVGLKGKPKRDLSGEIRRGFVPEHETVLRITIFVKMIQANCVSNKQRGPLRENAKAKHEHYH